MVSLYEEFLRGFEEAAGLDESEVHEQWIWFSRQLSNDRRRRIESGGYEAGRHEGSVFREMYPKE